MLIGLKSPSLYTSSFLGTMQIYSLRKDPRISVPLKISTVALIISFYNIVPTMLIEETSYATGPRCTIRENVEHCFFYFLRIWNFLKNIILLLRKKLQNNTKKVLQKGATSRRELIVVMLNCSIMYYLSILCPIIRMRPQ